MVKSPFLMVKSYFLLVKSPFVAAEIHIFVASSRLRSRPHCDPIFLAGLVVETNVVSAGQTSRVYNRPIVLVF